MGKTVFSESKNIQFNFKEIFKNQFFWTFSGFLALCLLMIVFSDKFLTYSNMINVLRQISINGVIAAGMTFVILTSGIDLSVGSVMAFSGTIMAGAMVNWGLSPILAVVIGICIGLIFGLINGSLVAFLKMPAIIVTLAMMEVPRGLALLYTGGYPLSGIPESFAVLGRGYWFNIIPVPVVIMLFVYLIAYLILNHLPMGRYIYAIGGNEEAVRLSGINVRLYKIIPFVISGITASVSGVLITSRLMSGQPMVGTGFELDAIAAVVLGGTDIAGGRGQIIGTLLGALILGVLNNGLNLMGISPYAQRVVKGLIIVIAVYFSSRKNNK
ncbi:ribose ABC transporter permease [Iocasia frigidifontis]|uniref:Ribose ABC transporter permease n=1 Tax=Iocasia fonsfrigidae TaxID=2682810 RepID=A0A8A7KLK6_9FIRM|nr:ribose ABC transporter permease [Iocasia fonsfrigidae]QTL99707.1 ribose ABC transporter permease [Iocasia fonsfrigidae]